MSKRSSTGVWLLRLLITAQLLSCLLVVSAPTTALASQASEAPHAIEATNVGSQQLAESGLQSVVQGRLANGLRYAILPRKGNDPGVSLRLRVGGGFLAEQRPGERGLAHLLEHLIFHSPTRSAPNELRRFQQVGFPLTLPEPAGGTTSWRESDYFIVSRTNQPADLDTLLGLFREVFSELTLRADAVDGQRAEVMREMAEKRLGNDLYAEYIRAVAPGSPSDVIDAQNSDDVSIASIATIRDIYERLYRPENTTIVVVGDIDASAMQILIDRHFGDWRGTRSMPVDRVIPAFNRNRIAPISYSDHPYGRNTAMLTLTMELPLPWPSRVSQIEAMVMDMLVTKAVSNRLAVTRQDYPPGKFGMFIENGEQGHRTFIIWDDFVPGQWRPAAIGLSGMSCSLQTMGFSEKEWTAAKQQVVEELNLRANSMAAESNFALAVELSNAATNRRDLIPPNELLAHAQSWLPTLDVRHGNDWWRHQWLSGAQHLRVEAPELARLSDAVSAIRSTVDDALRTGGCKALAH
jgi:Insulinase (Peptidase family M16)/Peptidase M16 inactive domain